MSNLDTVSSEVLLLSGFSVSTQELHDQEWEKWFEELTTEEQEDVTSSNSDLPW